ncbi:cysteine proteinase [Microthyrium microscopicum]|uniref:Cysteine proteinase n=1 Tax=Microthyrium microscopicum TaxID=703497 RepID=A0A6A6UP22_9PEZI|nr:cysteine proteinase [Microthyrium microscopicum]
MPPRRDPLPPPPPKPMYPIPAPITIRLITDYPHPPPPLPIPLPPSPIHEPRHRLNKLGPPPPPPPGSIISRRRYKNDQFYRAWDRFTLQKQRSKKEEVGEGRAGKFKDKNKVVRPVPSLDTDIEGQPGHAVNINEEGVESSQKAWTSYKEAADSCKAKVEAIVRECKRLNQKYHDRMFCLPEWDTLVSLGADEQPSSVKDVVGVGAVKRVEDIFDEPEFFEDGPSANDIRQGNVGDCWFLAAITALSGKPELIEKLCVARDEKVGVYGFVFFRDGEWISEVVDDRLALRYSDDQQQHPTDFLVITRGDKNALTHSLQEMGHVVQVLPKDFSQTLRRGSNALYFGSCRESNETWLPLIEKAYAKAHGDYQSIDGGVTGEGIEDLTGGVASYVRSENVLDKAQLWGELMQVNDKFLFGCGTRKGRDSDSADDEGFVRGHAYTVLEAREIDAPPLEGRKLSKKKLKEEQEKRKKEITKDGKIRLLKLHNPWGNQEWNGAWSDGSKEWTPDVLKELNHTMGDDGTFFISYQDFLKYYPVIDRIRLIGPEWTVTQQWTSVNVPWTTDYLDTGFEVTVTKAGPVVLVLSQPDTRYFKGLTGRYKYSLHFRLYKKGENIYLLRSMQQSGNMRSCNAEIDLEPGTYELLLKITAERVDNKRTPDQIIREYRDDRREKLLAIGKSFDLTHSKGKLRELEIGNYDNELKENKQRNRDEMVRQRARRQKERDREKARHKRLRDELDKKVAAKKKIRDEKMKKRDEELKKKRDEQIKKEKEEYARQKKAHRKARKQRKARKAEKKKKGKTAPDDDGTNKADDPEHTGDTKLVNPLNGDHRISPQEVESASDISSTSSESSGSEGSPYDSGEERPKRPKHIPLDVPKSKAQERVAPITPGSSTASVEPEASNDTDKPTVPPEEKIPPSKVFVFEPTPKDSQDTDNQAESPDAPDTSPPKPTDHPQKPTDDDPNIRGPRFPQNFPPPPRHLPPGHPGHHGPPGPPPPGEVIIIDRPRPGMMPPGPPRHMHHRRRSFSSGGSDRGPPISPVSSVCDDDFPWDSDIDGPPSSDRSDGDDGGLGAGGRGSGSGSSDDEMYADDPWQATCVIGLRVCSLDEGAGIEVVRGRERRGRSEIAMGRARSPV